MKLWAICALVGFYVSHAHADHGCAAEFRVDQDYNEMVTRTADFFVRNKRLPTAGDIAPKRKSRQGEGERLFTTRELLSDAADDFPELFREIKLKIAQKIMQFAVARFRYPDDEELLDLIGWRVNGSDFSWLSRALLGPREELFAFARDTYPEFALKIQDKLAEAFLRAMSSQQRQATQPTEEQIYFSLFRNKQNLALQADVFNKRFTLDHFRRLIGTADAASDQLRVIEGGVATLEETARMNSPGRFKNYRAVEFVRTDRAERLKTALETKGGFLVTSVNAGMPLVEEMYLTMLKYAEDIDYDIVIIPTNNQTEGLDKRLLDHPRIHILTHTIENRYFKLWNIGIMPKNQNAFASLDARKQTLPGQVVFVGHPQLQHRVLPSSSNHLRETQLWSTGSLSKNYYPFLYPQQARTSELAKEYHKNSFIVVPKADGESGFDGRGVANLWQPRPIEFKMHERDLRWGFTDLGKEYYVRDGVAVVGQQNPEALMTGDMHEEITDQNYLAAYGELLAPFPVNSIRVFFEDPMDNTSSSRHDYERYGTWVQKFNSGQLNVAGEFRGAIQMDNAFAAIPSVGVRVYKDSNHSYWVKDLLDKRPQVHQVVNGRIMAELTYARDVLGIAEPLEYMLRERPAQVAKMPAHVRRDVEENDLLSLDPLRVQVLPFGKPMVLGPEWRPVHVNHHGHHGNNGARSSLKSHAGGNQRCVVGDSHQTAILGDAFNVGTSTPKKIGYNDAGYSSWSNSSAFIYPDGTVQLLTYNALAATMFPRPGKKAMSAKRFFGEDKLQIRLNDNDLLPGVEIYDQMSEWGRMRGQKVSKPLPPRAA